MHSGSDTRYEHLADELKKKGINWKLAAWATVNNWVMALSLLLNSVSVSERNGCNPPYLSICS
jgi:hypothetical protein